MPATITQYTHYNSDATASSVCRATYPVNIQVGDLLLIICGNDDNTDTAQWNNTTLKPTTTANWQMLIEGGDSAVDCHIAAFWKICQSTDVAEKDDVGYIEWSAQSADNNWAVMFRITGHDAADPIDWVPSLASTDNTPTPFTITAGSNSAVGGLAIAAAAYDGSDSGNFTWGGTGWTEGGEVSATSNANYACGTWAYKENVGVGSTVAPTVQPATSDGMVGFVITINAGASTLTGSGGLTVGQVAVAGTGARSGTRSGSGGFTLGSIAIAGTGARSHTHSGSGGLDLGNITIDGAGTSVKTHDGSGNLGLGDISIAGTGSRATQRSGSGAIAIADISIAGVGARDHTHSGAGGLTIGDISIAGTGLRVHTHSSSGDLALGTITIAGAGTVTTTSSELTGSGDIAIGGVAVAGTGSRVHSHSGSGDLALGDITISGTASRATDRNGSGSINLGQIDIAGTGARVHTHSGSGAIALADITVDGTADITTPLIDINLVSMVGDARISLTNLRWSWFDSVSPASMGVPVIQGTTEETDGSGNLALRLVGSALTAGQEGTLVLRDPTNSYIGAYRLAVT